MSGSEVDGLRSVMDAGHALVLTGAGISTGSGVPDYRGPDGRQRADRPMTIDRFVSGPGQQHAGLHTAAGTADVHAIHGRLDEVHCLDCGEVAGRDVLADGLEAANPASAPKSEQMRPRSARMATSCCTRRTSGASGTSPARAAADG